MSVASVLAAPAPSVPGGAASGATAERIDATYRTLFECSPVGMAVLRADTAGTAIISDVNDALAAVFRCSRSQLIDRGLHELVGAEAAQLPATAGSAAAVDRPLMLSDGAEIWTRWRVTELPGGRARTWMALIEDVTEQRMRDRQAQRQARLLELVPEPVIIRSLDGTIRYWNAGAAQVYGHSASAALGSRTHDLLATQFCGTDLAGVEHELAEVGTWSGRLLHRHADGHVLQVSSKHVYDLHDDGEPVILEINIDVSDRVAAEQALQASEAKFRTQFAHSTVGQLIRRPDGIIEDVNAALAGMLGYEIDDLVGTSVDRLYETATSAIRSQTVAALDAGEIDAISGEGCLVRADGRLLDVEMNISAARHTSGELAHLICIYQDISARKIADHALRQQALHDPLTGLPNRALLCSELDTTLSAESAHPVGLLFLDLDGFKGVNDQYGHAVGDELLEEVAARLRMCVRVTDTVARLGGDEFVILCPALETQADLDGVARRALDRLSRPYELSGAVVTDMTVSIGMTLPTSGTTATRALGEADRAMYVVKRAGKNNVSTASDS